MWDAFLSVCTVVGMITIYTAAVGTVLVWALRAIRRRAARAEGRLAAGAPLGIERRARSWDELPEWVSQDREWAAAVVILGSASIAERTADHVDFIERQVDWEGLRRASCAWDDHARALVEAADTLAHAEASGHVAHSPCPSPGTSSSSR